MAPDALRLNSGLCSGRAKNAGTGTSPRTLVGEPAFLGSATDFPGDPVTRATRASGGPGREHAHPKLIDRQDRLPQEGAVDQAARHDPNLRPTPGATDFRADSARFD